MADFEIVCLANSRKRSGRCIAGLRTDGSGWIRPVTEDGPLNRRHYLLDDSTEPIVLDILNINLRKSVPKPYQPENWLIGDLPWHLKTRPAPRRYIPLIRRFIENGPDLFGNTSDRVPLKSIIEKPVQASLTLIIPNGLSWLVTRSIRGNRQIRARFTISRVHYDLAVTDHLLEHNLSSLAEGVYSSSQIGIEENVEILFTISLAGPLHGECFKLVAGVIML